MVLKEQVEALGREVRRLRLAKGITTVTELHNRTNISRAFLSQIENAYEHPKRGLVIPTDSMLDRLAKELDVPVSRLHSILGRFPEEVRKFSAEAEGIAEDFDRLPPLAKKIVRDAARTAKEIAAELTVEIFPNGSSLEE